MALSESEFETRADALLDHLMEVLEDTLGDALDVDLDAGILTIELDSGGQYVINKHKPNRQIWMSSPASGASHFDCDADGGWVETRGGGALDEMLAGELSAATGRTVRLG